MPIGNNYVIGSQHLILKFNVFADKQNLLECWQRLYYLRTLNGLCNHFPPLPTETCCVWSIHHPTGEGLSQAGTMWTFWKMFLLRILYSLLATCLYRDWPRLYGSPVLVSPSGPCVFSHLKLGAHKAGGA